MEKKSTGRPADAPKGSGLVVDVEQPSGPSQAVWRRHATQWARVGAPLRPGPHDIAATAGAVAELSARRRITHPHLLILGVTPELCGLSAASSGRFVAIDKSIDMIGAHWKHSEYSNGSVVCADWRQMPCPSTSIDIVLGDGSLSALSFPDGYASTSAELQRVLRPGGQCVLRCFVQPDKAETPAHVFDDLLDGRIGNFHILKWRLAMALQHTVEEGISVGLVWTALNREWPDLSILAERLAWPIQEVRTIEAYRGIDTRYTFPTIGEYRHILFEAGFAIREVRVPPYELGERCPTIVMESIIPKRSI